MKLEINHEFIGTLIDYTTNEDTIKLKFQIQITIEVPSKALSIEQLDKYMQKDIGIINIEEDYHLRKLRTPIDDFTE